MYLKGTKHLGTFITPTSTTMTLDYYADADFAGGYKIEDAEDPWSARSQTGFVITLGGSPIVWGSRLQSKTTLSTMEAKYIALSTAMQPLIPLWTIFGEHHLTFSLLPPAESTIRLTIFEDNNATRILATSDPPHRTQRSRHIHVKYHWFCGHLVPGIILIAGIDSKNQLGDIFTKCGITLWTPPRPSFGLDPI
jgi:hypothetical protein